MSNEKKSDRNRELVRKRDRNPKRWSFAALGAFYGIRPETAFEIYHREKARARIKVGKKPKPPASLTGKYNYIAQAA